MGLEFRTWCKRCLVEAPEVEIVSFGDAVTPTLAHPKASDAAPPFGAVYDGLAAVGLVTLELQAFRDFLAAHAGHPLADPDDEREDPATERRGHRRLKTFRVHRRGFGMGTHVLECPRCNAELASPSPEALSLSGPWMLDDTKIRTFRENVENADPVSFLGLGFPFDHLVAVSRFLRLHRKHGPIARVRPLQAPGEPGRPRLSWQPPPWAAEESERYLGKVPRSLIPRLWGLYHRDEAKRAAACAGVGASRQKGALGYLVPLLDDPSPAVRSAAARAVGALRDARGVRTLGRAILDERQVVRDAGAEALKALGQGKAYALRQARSLRGPYRGPSTTARSMARDAASLARRWRDPGGDCLEATESIAAKRREPWALEQLVLLTAHPEPSVRCRALEALARSRHTRAADAIVALASDRTEFVSVRAIEAAGAQRLRAAVPACVDALGVPGVATEAGAALARMRDRRALGGVLGALSLPSVDSRMAAIRALGPIADSRAVTELAGPLKDETPSVREAAADALGALGDSRAVLGLSPLLRDENPRVRDTAAAALARIGGKEAISSLEAHFRRRSEADRQTVVEALAQWPGKEAVPLLVSCLESRSTRIRSRAATALATLRDPAGERALVAAARRGDPNVARAAWKWLVERGDPGTLAALEAALRADVLGEIARFVVDCGNDRLEAAAKKALRGRDAHVQEAQVRWGQSQASGREPA